MRPPIALLPAVMILPLAANAQEPRKASPPPASPAPSPLARGGGPPTITVVDGVRDGNLRVRKFMYTQVPEMYTVQESVPVTVDGKTEMKTVTTAKTRFRFVSNVQLESYPLADVQVFDTEGRPLSHERILALFSNPRMVLTTIRGMTVDPAYMQLVRPGTYLVVLPVPPPPVMPMPVPAPAARHAESPKAAAPPAAVAAPAAAPRPESLEDAIKERRAIIRKEYGEFPKK